MAVNLAQFRTLHPEFESVSDALVNAALADALAETTAAGIDAGLADEHQHFMAAHLIAVSPYAKSSRLVNEDGTTTYQGNYERIWWRNISGL